MQNNKVRLFVMLRIGRTLVGVILATTSIASMGQVTNDVNPYKVWEMRGQLHIKSGDLVCAYKDNLFGLVSEVSNDFVLIDDPKMALGEDGLFFRFDELEPGERVQFISLGLDKIEVRRTEASLCPTR